MEKDQARRRSLIFLALVLLGATLYSFLVTQGNPVLRFSAQNRTFAFEGPKHTSVQFSLDTLERLELYTAPLPDLGTARDGGEVLGGYRYGTWESESLGSYQAFLSTRIPALILAADAEKTALFNTANPETMESLYQQLYAFWQGETEIKK